MESTRPLVWLKAKDNPLAIVKPRAMKSPCHQSHGERPRLREVVLIKGCIQIAALEYSWAQCAFKDPMVP